MIFGRGARPGGTSVPPGTGTYTIPSDLASGGIDTIEERLQQIRDEEAWRNSHTKLVLKYNFSSLAFWLLSVASLSFAILNAHHGYSAVATSSVLNALVIAFMYFAIELTIPVSAHWISWSGDGGNKWTVRSIGLIAYVLGVTFSLLILQGKFSGAADSAQATKEVSALTFSSDTTSLEQAMKQREELAPKVKRNAEAVAGEIDSIFSTAFQKVTLREKTNSCNSRQRPGRERDLCARIAQLEIEKGNAASLAELDAKIDALKTGLLTRAESGQVSNNSNASDEALSGITGISVATILTFKASLLAMIAALITHVLWGAHGIVVNASIRGRQREHMEINALQRMADRERSKINKSVEDTAAAFARKKGMAQGVVNSLETAPIREQPATLQVQAFFNEKTVMGDHYSQSIGIIHDEYVRWAQSGKLTVLNISRFGEVVRGLGMTISSDGRIIGAALRAG